MTNDVEKRWHDPATFRAAVRYAVAIVAVAGVALVAYAFTKATVAGILVPTVLFGGGLGAFVRTYRVWRTEGTWPIWQGAGFFLFALFLVSLPVAGTALSS
ncbi:hypothetical protein [Mycolicibacterium poriferae]|uniref:hypothetical protein n=1 Tax=Mycolicibacterium poriferae TaxID=39694 RepID=UPI0024B8FC9A|nr:hypothetical protein [Mycolicibacterium poriferae]